MTIPLNMNVAVNDVPIPKLVSSDEEDAVDLELVQHEAEEAQKCAEELVAAAKLKNNEISHHKKVCEERKCMEEKQWLEAEQKCEADKCEAKRVANAKAVADVAEVK